MRADQEPSTSGRVIIEGEEEEREEREGERFDQRAVVLSLTEQATLLGDSDSSGYSPSPNRDMHVQPISLLDELNLAFPPSRGGPSRAPPVAPPVNPPTTTASTSLQQQRDKRPLESPQGTRPPLQRRRTGEANSSRTSTDSPPLIQSWAPVLARPDGTPLNMVDKVSSVDVAYGVSRAALLPLDMEREKNCSYDALTKSIFQSSVKVWILPYFIACQCGYCYYNSRVIRSVYFR